MKSRIWKYFLVFAGGLLGVSLMLHGSLPFLSVGAWEYGGDMAQARMRSAAARLGAGAVLVSGGDTGSGPSSSVEVFDSSGTFVPAEPMYYARAGHTAVTLPSGAVLVAGGVTSGGAPTSAAEVYDGAWTIVGGMHVARRGHTATLLSNGRILIAGGDTGSGLTGVLESFDPATGVFTVLSAELAFPRSGHAAAALRDGRVVLAGGAGEEGLLASTEIFDPASGSLLAGPALSLARTGLTATALIDGTVLLAGGSAATGQASLAEVHDGSAIRAAGSMFSARAFHLAITMPGAGKVLMTSGRRRGKTAELYVPWTETFEPAGKLQQSRSSAAGASAGLDGLLMVAGGRGSGRILKSSELYRYSTVTTGKDDYRPGEAVVMTGGGWEPGETVSLLLEEDPFTHDDIVLTAVADAAGRFRNAEYAPAEHDIGTRFYLTATGEKSGRAAQTTFTDGFPAGDLDQCENGSVANFLSGGTTLPCTGSNWVNGNVNEQKAHYVEGDFLSYRLHLTGLNGETSVTTTIEWDITKQARHAIDYIGQWNDPNSGDPCGDLLSAAECAAQPAPAPIPADTAKAPPAGQKPGGVMRLYGDASATISFGSYVGVNEGTDTESRRIQMTISKTAATDELVLAWGGHISDFEDWNPVGDEGELTASAISGSPYHMRLIEVNGKGGNQDRSLSTSAIILDGTLTVFKEVVNDDGGAAVPGDFSIHVQSAAGEVPGSPAPGVSVAGGGTSYLLLAGTYAVSEDVLSGYLLAGFSGNCDSSGIVTVAPGGTSTCTITNDDIEPKLTVTKIVVNDDGGTKQISDFPLFVDGGPVTSGAEGAYSTGTYTVSETADPGYAATIGGDCAADGSVTLNPGDVKACTITNDDIAAKLTVTKIVVNDDGGTKQVADFALFVDGGPVTSGSEGTFSTGVHLVSETADPGYAATIGGDCAADGSVTLNPGDVKACTITNDDINDDINDDVVTSGSQKTIGFWKTHCDPSLLPRIVGQFMVKNCDQAVLLLDKRGQAGKKRANDAAYGLAAQLLAALLNKMAGNGCARGEENQAVNDARTLLSNLGFSGSGSYLLPRSHGQRALALSLANALDTFNNGLLCP